MILALRIFGLFVLAGLAMAAFGLGVSFLIPMDPINLRAGMLLSVLAFSVIGLFYAMRFWVRINR
jgi:hypothetical protein